MVMKLDNVLCCMFNKLTSVFLCVCPVIDHEFRHNIVKVAVDPRGDKISVVIVKFCFLSVFALTVHKTQ